MASPDTAASDDAKLLPDGGLDPAVSEFDTAPQETLVQPPQAAGSVEPEPPAQDASFVEPSQEAEAGAEWTGQETEAGAEWTGQEAEAGAEWTGQEAEAGAEWTGQEAEAGAEWTGQEAEAGAEWTGQEAEAGAEWTGQEAEAGAEWTGQEAEAGAAIEAGADSGWGEGEEEQAGAWDTDAYGDDGGDGEVTSAAAWGDGLNAEQWEEVQNSSILDRTVAGWDIFQFSLDGVTMQKYYQHHLTGQSQWEAPVEVTRALATEMRASKLNEFAHEGLDEDDDPKPWFPPTIARAYRARFRRIFGQGKSGYCSSKEDDFAAMGVGVSLYFRLLRTLAVFFAIATLLYVPALIMFSNGSRIPSSFLDPLSSALLTLGNIGSRELAAAETSIVSGDTPNFAQLPHGSVSGYDASYIISYLDLGVVVVFLILVTQFSQRIDDDVNQAEKRVIRARDYTIFVRGLPGDATEQELRDFFSARFALDDLDLQFRILDKQDVSAEARDRMEAGKAGLISQLRTKYGVSQAATKRIAKRVRGGVRLRQVAAAFTAGSPAGTAAASNGAAKFDDGKMIDNGGVLLAAAVDEAPEDDSSGIAMTGSTKEVADTIVPRTAAETIVPGPAAEAKPTTPPTASSSSAAADSKPTIDPTAAGVIPSMEEAMKLVDVTEQEPVDDKPAGGTLTATSPHEKSFKLPEFEARERARKRAAERALKAGKSFRSLLNREATDVSVVGFRARALKRTASGRATKEQVDEAMVALRNRLAVYTGVSVMDVAAAEAETAGRAGLALGSPMHADTSSPMSSGGGSSSHDGRTTRAGGRRFDFTELQRIGGTSLVDRADGIMSASARMAVIPVFHPSLSPDRQSSPGFPVSPGNTADSLASPDKINTSTSGVVKAMSQSGSVSPKKGHSPKKSKKAKEAETPTEIRVLPFTYGYDGSVEVAGMEGEGMTGGSAAVPTGVQPVLDVTHNSKLDFLGSWVADVALVKGDGLSLRAFKAAEKLNQKLRTARAMVKMARGDTPLAKGPDEQALTKASMLVDKLGSHITELRQRVGTASRTTRSSMAGASSAGTSIGDFAVGAMAAAIDSATGDHSAEQGDVRGGFVTFEHEESFLRVMAAYRGSHRWFFRCCQKVGLRFRGTHKLIIKQAPDASDVLWEYLGTSNTERSCRRFLTACVALILLVGAFILVLVAQAAKTTLSSQIPDLAACDSALPAAFFGGFANASAAAVAAGGAQAAVSLGTSSPVLLDRPTGVGQSSFEQNEKDTECGAGKFHIGYLSSDLAPFVVGGYPTSQSGINAACQVTDTTSGTGLPAGVVIGNPACPNPLTKAAIGQCPCVPASSIESCSTAPCFYPELETEEVQCKQFPVNTIVGCYCLSIFQRLLTSDGAIDGTARFVEEHQRVCGDFAGAYAQTQALTVVASLAAAVVNVVLAALMKRLVEFERHISVSERSRALVSKTTIAQVFNTAIVMLLAQMRLPNDAAANIPVLNELGILQGSHDSFTWRWYTDIGFGIFTTLTVTAVLTGLMPVLGYLFVQLGRCRAGETPVIASKGTVKTQHQLDKLYIGPAPSFAERYPPLLALAVVAIVYGVGIPMLAPVACIAFSVTYAFDKFLLLYFQRKPPAYNGALARYAAGILPYAIVGHCVMAVLMLGQPDVLPSHSLPTVASVLTPDVSGSIASVLTAARRLDSIGALQRLSRWNTVFFGILGVILFTWLIIRGILWMTLLNCISACGIGDLCSCDCCSNEAQGLPPRKWAAPFSAAYGRAMDDRADKWRRTSCKERTPALLKCCCCCCFSNKEEAHSERVQRFEKVKLKPVELSQGWRIERLGHVAVMRKVYNNNNVAGGAAAEEEDPTNVRLKLTWEVINDLSGLSSYALEANPDYAQAVVASGAKVKGRSMRGRSFARPKPGTQQTDSSRIDETDEEEDDDDDDDDEDEEEDVRPHGEFDDDLDDGIGDVTQLQDAPLRKARRG